MVLDTFRQFSAGFEFLDYDIVIQYSKYSEHNDFASNIVQEFLLNYSKIKIQNQ